VKARSFKVPFSKVVGDDATEVEYGPDDCMVVRPLFGLPSGRAQEWARRIAGVRRDAREAAASDDEAAKEAAGDAVDQLVLDLVAEQVDDWRLVGPDGPLLKPATPADLGALPFALRGALFGFFENYRGDGPNPTTGG
jgi:hypothetical protein